MDDLITEFITETTESLASLDRQMIALERNPGDEATLEDIFRMFHTIKGTCGFLGLPRLETLAHAAEDVLGKLRDKAIQATPEAVTLVLNTIDAIKELVVHLDANGHEPPGDDTALIERLKRLAEQSAPPPANPEFPYFKGDDEPAPAAPAMPPPKANVEEREAAPVHSIRVNLDVLEHLMQTVSELVLTRNQLLQVARHKHDQDFTAPLHQLSHLTSDLQEGVMKTRMQPIGNAWTSFPRVVRDLCLELGKKIDLRTEGADTELDRQMLEVIKDPLLHMLRNSCDHGLEKPADRVAAGKPETGTITLSAFHEGGHIVIEIADDGRGINIERVRQKALDKKFATEEALAAMSDKEIAQFIFAPGFSTAEQITSVSGRGVGMDVVKYNIEKIGGSLALNSNWGKGSSITIRIPLTLAIVSVLLVEAHGQKFAIPQLNVTELVRVTHSGPVAQRLEIVNQTLMLRLRDKLLPMAVLSDLIGFPTDHKAFLDQSNFVAVCRMGGAEFGVLVDRVFGSEEIVVKPVSSALKHIPIYSGNTVLGDGSVIMILDPAGIARTVSNVDTVHTQVTSARNPHTAEEELYGFLLFSLGRGAPKAVPIELVSRLEEVDLDTIEIAGDHPAVQYHGDLMRLVSFDPDLPSQGMVDVIVFGQGRRTVGLVVKGIIDIVHTPFSIKMTSEEGREHGYLGSTVIAGKSTDVIDVGYVFTHLAGYGKAVA